MSSPILGSSSTQGAQANPLPLKCSESFTVDLSSIQDHLPWNKQNLSFELHYSLLAPVSEGALDTVFQFIGKKIGATTEHRITLSRKELPDNTKGKTVNRDSKEPWQMLRFGVSLQTNSGALVGFFNGKGGVTLTLKEKNSTNQYQVVVNRNSLDKFLVNAGVLTDIPANLTDDKYTQYFLRAFADLYLKMNQRETFFTKLAQNIQDHPMRWLTGSAVALGSYFIYTNPVTSILTAVASGAIYVYKRSHNRGAQAEEFLDSAPHSTASSTTSADDEGHETASTTSSGGEQEEWSSAVGASALVVPLSTPSGEGLLQSDAALLNKYMVRRQALGIELKSHEFILQNFQEIGGAEVEQDIIELTQQVQDIEQQIAQIDQEIQKIEAKRRSLVDSSGLGHENFGLSIAASLLDKVGSASAGAGEAAPSIASKTLDDIALGAHTQTLPKDEPLALYE